MKRPVVAASVLWITAASAACHRGASEYAGPGEVTVKEFGLAMTLPAGAKAQVVEIREPDGRDAKAMSILMPTGYPVLVSFPKLAPIAGRRMSYERSHELEAKHPELDANTLDIMIDAPDAFVSHRATPAGAPACEAMACKALGERTVCIGADLLVADVASRDGKTSTRVGITDADCTGIVPIVRSIRDAR